VDSAKKKIKAKIQTTFHKIFRRNEFLLEFDFPTFIQSSVFALKSSQKNPLKLN
jgi:hypothetical protein